MAAAAALAACSPAFALDPPTVNDLTAVPFEQLVNMEVYSASRFMQKASEAPATVTVITAADIRAYGWRTLADVARSVRGMNVHDDHNYTYLGERGFLRPGDYNSRFLVQVDGMRVNDVVYDQAPIGGEFPLELELIDRIEFVPGPGSSVYGSSAFFGVINVITRRPAELQGTRASVTLGQAGLHKATASTGGATEGATWLLAASAYVRDGRDLYFPEFDTPDQNHGVARGLDWERGQRVYVSAVDGAWRATAMHARRDKGIPTASFDQPFNDGRTATEDAQSYADLSWHGDRGTEQWLARAFAGRYSSVGDYVDVLEGGAVINRDGSVGTWWGMELKLVSLRFAGHKLVTGFEYQRDGKLQQRNFDVSPYTPYLDDTRSGNRAGVYAQDEWTLTRQVLLNAGLRYDRYAGMPGVTSPRAALIVQATPSGTFKAIYGRAFRQPNSYEKFYEFLGEGGQLANPLLQRERIATREVAWVQQFGDSRRLTVSAFRNVVDNLITQLDDPGAGLPKFFNVGHVAAHGIEAEYEQQFDSGASLRASVSRFDSGPETDILPVSPNAAQGAPDDTQSQQLNAPERLAKLNVAAPLGGGWRAGFEAQYVGPRHALLGRAGGYTVANLNLYKVRFWRGGELALTAYNLLGRAYADPGAREHRQATIPQDGRVLQARLAWSF
ncbi:MAG: TonB-dependent receptor plug domain-containing protein [Telluria sp.]